MSLSDDEPEGPDDYFDAAGDGLSDIGNAAFQVLKENYWIHRRRCWNVSHGKVVGEARQTPPRDTWGNLAYIVDENPETHSDCFPEDVFNMMTKAEQWVDLTSLSAPTGKFCEKITAAIQQLHESGNEVTIRLLFGNISGMPTNCEGLVQTFTKGLPADDTKIKLWVGAWRKGFTTWNHSKIIAVDGQYLYEGGHNLWDPHYLRTDPVHDISMEAEGQVAVDGHCFANRMWDFVNKTDADYWAMKAVPDWVPAVVVDRVTVSQWPKAERDYPPMYTPESSPLQLPDAIEGGDLAMITMGRYGALHTHEETANPSDAAIVAALGAAQKIIRMSLQDLGPLTIPFVPGPKAIPSGVWPVEYLTAIGLAIWERGVDVEIMVSNPAATPGGLNPLTACYGNGWTTSDVASEIIKALLNQSPEANDEDEKLRGLIKDNLRICTVSTEGQGNQWPDEQTQGNHAKFFIIDDKCYYMGSQNLYIANLAEWGILIDNEEQTAKILEEYWNPMWEQSWSEDVTDVDAVMDGLSIDRNGGDEDPDDEEVVNNIIQAQRASAGHGARCRSLGVWVRRASGLADTDGLGAGSADSYAMVRIIDDDGNTMAGPGYTGVIQDGGANPEWNDLITFEGLDKPTSYKLVVTVLDKDSFLGFGGDVADYMAADDKLGKATFDLGELDNSEEWQEKELCIADGWFSDSNVTIAFNTAGQWGN